MARDIIHEQVKRALIKDGWTITDDPLFLLSDEDNLPVDLGAEKLVVAEKGSERIAVEIKTFSAPSIMYEFHRALGQYINYESALMLMEDDRELWVAIPEEIHERFSKSRIIQRSIERIKMKFILANIEQEEITAWKSQ